MSDGNVERLVEVSGPGLFAVCNDGETSLPHRETAVGRHEKKKVAAIQRHAGDPWPGDPPGRSGNAWLGSRF